jgi:dipeptidyl aminopeptidase/acylaminoacyl peptidase
LVSPGGDTLLQVTLVRYPPVSELARPFLRLAGARVTPQNHGLHASPYWSDMTLTSVRDGTQRKVALPAGTAIGRPYWSLDGSKVAFASTTDTEVALWVVDTASASARKIANVRLNPVLGGTLLWMPDKKTLLVKLVPAGQAAPPQRPLVPPGPDVQETSAAKGAMSTYEVRDVLQSPYDEDLFDYYATSQLALVDSDTGAVSPIGKPALYAEATPAPSGDLILVQTIHRPYSYLTTSERFPREVDIIDREGRLVHHLDSSPLADHVPIWGVPTGPRDFEWRPTEPATLVWAEALDGGDWNAKVPQRDRILMQAAPFAQSAVEIMRTEQRYGGFYWGERRDFALIEEYDEIKHRRRTHALNVDDPKTPPRLVWDRSSDELYKNPGYPVTRVLPNGFSAVRQVGDFIFLYGQGASTEGDRPFLDKFNTVTLTGERLFRSGRAEFEQFVAWYDPTKSFITRHESPTEPPNFFVRTLGEAIAGAPAGEPERASSSRAISAYTDPVPEVRGITKRLVRYKRADGVDLSFNLYLPPGYKEGTRLPTVVWAYPLDYADPQMAGQVSGSTQRFTILGWPLQLFCLLDGYAVLDNPSMPIVGDSNRIYDTYMEQLVAGAKAAVDKAVELGVTDPERVGITGHSHGALMTANLLAHSDLFRAGVARSGAYNKSLTAFGFQNERRTLWEATDVYEKVSPLFHADKIKAPLLLIHGEADANPGTVPLQSQKLYEAIRGNGGTARLVMLPFESHGYSAMESNEQVLYEMLRWFDLYVKNAPPRSKAAGDSAGPQAQGSKG